jgi:hypothetical protein
MGLLKVEIVVIHEHAFEELHNDTFTIVSHVQTLMCRELTYYTRRQYDMNSFGSVATYLRTLSTESVGTCR